MKFPALLVFLLLSASCAAQQYASDTVTVYFGFNEAVLSEQKLFAIAERADAWGTGGHRVLDIVSMGYTDTVGTIAYNERLALKRAGYISGFLQRHLANGLIRFTTEGYGEWGAEPVIDSLNRRVVIVARYSAAGVRNERINATLVRDTVIQLRNIQFVEDHDYLTSESMALMPNYVALLRRSKYDHISVIGYYNYDGALLRPTDKRFILSERRAKVIAEYFVEAGLDSSQISHRGGGNSRMIVDNPETVGEMRQNIRVEVILYRAAP